VLNLNERHALRLVLGLLDDGDILACELLFCGVMVGLPDRNDVHPLRRHLAEVALKLGGGVVGAPGG
jgi:hypothetical protein